MPFGQMPGVVCTEDAVKLVRPASRPFNTFLNVLPFVLSELPLGLSSYLCGHIANAMWSTGLVFFVMVPGDSDAQSQATDYKRFGPVRAAHES